VKAQSAPQAAAVPQPAPAPADPTGPGNANSSDKSPYGPVKNYLPKNTETGTKTDTPLKEIPQSISVVGAEQIRDMGAQTAQAALHYVPGVVAESYGNDGRTDGSFIRGTDAAEFLDGLKRTFDYYTYNYRIDPYFMERIEVLRGPASVLYGQAPVGGILNFVSKRPQKEQGGEITVEYGTFDFKQVKFDTTGLITSDGKWSYRLTGLARDADTQVDFVEDDRYAIQPAITYRPDSNTAITLLGHFQKDQTGSISQFFPHVGTIFPNADGKRISRNRYGGEPNDFYDTDVASGTLLIDHKFASWLRLQHSSRYTDLHNDYLGTYPDWSTYDPTAGTFNRIRGRMVTDTQIFNQDTNLEVKFATGALSHKVLGGVDYSDFKASQGSNYVYDLNSFNVYSPQYGQGLWYGDANCTGGPAYVTTSVNVQPCAATDTSAVQTGLYAQDQIRLGNWLGIVGLRQDWLETTTTQVKGQKDDALTYRAGLMYEFASGFTPYVSYGESFVPSVALTDPAKPPLVPQLGRMYEVGFKYQPVGAEFAINGAVYDISQNNRVVSDSTNPNYSVQIGPVAIKGLELELTGKVTQNLKVVGGYSYTQAEYTDGFAADDSALDGNQIESIPKHLASLWGVWEFDQPYLKGWSVGGGARYIGESWDETNTLRVPDVTLFDAMIAYEEEHWRWQITGTNLEDKEYASTCLARGDCFLGTARSVITGLTYKY
ncbi:MAG TPA: TonB-dependent siderophore receptor, partial [Fimbriimonas sp.]|nr:TonB-dependent siderophore receptor [Fimbriimonas sp.]